MNDVTIVVATYNRPAFLEIMLCSIIDSAALVPNPVRILVVDDCSTVEGAEIVANDLGVEYMRLPENRGVAGALHAGFLEVKSEFYAFWGDDDAFLPNWFRLHLAKIAEGFDVVAGSFWKANSQLQRKKQVILPVASLAELRRGNVQCNDGSLVRRSSVDPSWFRPERERAMMMTFWLAMASAGRKFTSVKEPTWLYRRHDGNLSNHRSAHDNALRAEAMAEYAP
jgi:glycosyltransferase involved in cell wall biosynthesis